MSHHDCQVVSAHDPLPPTRPEPGESHIQLLERLRDERNEGLVREFTKLLELCFFGDIEISVRPGTYRLCGDLAWLEVEIGIDAGSPVAMLQDAIRGVEATAGELKALLAYQQQKQCECCGAPLGDRRHLGTYGVRFGAVCEACHQSSQSGR